MRRYPYIVAEIGANHNGDMDLAKKLIRTAKDCGADCVKFQLFNKNDLNTYDNMVDLDRGVVKLENVDKWEDKSLGLNNIFQQVEKFAVQEKEHIEFIEPDLEFTLFQTISNCQGIYLQQRPSRRCPTMRQDGPLCGSASQGSRRAPIHRMSEGACGRV